MKETCLPHKGVEAFDIIVEVVYIILGGPILKPYTNFKISNTLFFFTAPKYILSVERCCRVTVNTSLPIVNEVFFSPSCGVSFLLIICSHTWEKLNKGGAGHKDGHPESSVDTSQRNINKSKRTDLDF